MLEENARISESPLLRYRLGDCAPMDILRDPELSERDKLAVLRQWEHDAIEMMVAEEENMGGGPPAPLSEIQDAMRALKTGRAPAPGSAHPRPGGSTVGEVMTTLVKTVHADNRIADVARQMAADNVGLYVVLDGDAVAGVVTDRDITVRGVAGGLLAGQRPIADVMTNRIVACPHTATLDQAADMMAREGVRRLCVVDGDGALVGIASLSDLALGKDGDATIGRVLRVITRAPAASALDMGLPTSRNTETSQPGGLHVYSMRPMVRS